MSKELNIKTSTESKDNLNIDKIEQKFNVKYIGDFCIKTKQSNWGNFPVSIFYQEKPKIELGHTHYLGVYYNSLISKAVLVNGESAFSKNIVGVIADNGQIVISSYRHGFITSDDESVSIDGGRDYTIITPPNRKTVHLKMINGKFKIIKNMIYKNVNEKNIYQYGNGKYRVRINKNGTKISASFNLMSSAIIYRDSLLKTSPVALKSVKTSNPRSTKDIDYYIKKDNELEHLLSDYIHKSKNNNNFTLLKDLNTIHLQNIVKKEIENLQPSTNFIKSLTQNKYYKELLSREVK